MMIKDWTSGSKRILAQRCDAGHVWYLTRQRCPICGLQASFFEPAPEGSVIAVTTLDRRNGDSVYRVAIALVELEAGLRLMARAPLDVLPGASVTVSVGHVEDSDRFLPIAEVSSE